MNLLVYIRLFPIYMQSLVKFKLKFSRGRIKDFETIRRARYATSSVSNCCCTVNSVSSHVVL